MSLKFLNYSINLITINYCDYYATDIIIVTILNIQLISSSHVACESGNFWSATSVNEL